jgi:hypothetical protein
MIRLIPVMLLLTVTAPSTIDTLFSATSVTPGLLPCALLWTFLGLSGGGAPYALERADVQRLCGVLLVIALLAIHLMISTFEVQGADFFRFYGSCAILLLVWTGATFAARTFTRATNSNLIAAADLVLVCLSFLAIAAIAGVPAVGPVTAAKGVVIFPEPSHFALSYLPLLMFRVSVSTRSTQYVLLAIALAIAGILQNLTMVVGLLDISTLMLRRGSLLLMLGTVGLAASTLDISYYLGRLDLTTDTTNISALVFLQGWQNAILNLSQTHGVGVGFQQFGIVGSLGDISYRIADYLGGLYLNLRDGGSTAAKLVGEFGVFGIALLLAYLLLALRSVRYLRAAQSLPVTERDPRALFLHSLVLSFLFELFMRGLGYFSPGGFLALAALLALQRRHSARVAENDAAVIVPKDLQSV